MKYIWLSFSKDGVNQGCCNIEATSKKEALALCDSLGIVPEYDDIMAFSISEPELPLNKLMSKNFLIDGEWENIHFVRRTK